METRPYPLWHSLPVQPAQPQRAWVVPTTVGAALLLVLPLIVAISSCSSDKAAAQAALEYTRTELATKVQGLLDRSAYQAAEGIFQAKLPLHPDDAGLHVQYARYLLLTQSLHSPDYIYTPLGPNDREQYHALWVAKEAGRRAVQLDPEIAPHFAAVVLTTLRDRIDKELAAGNGVISRPYFQEGFIMKHGFDKAMLCVAWTALEADPKTSALFVKDFRALTDKAIEIGKVTSAAMLANLLGDLEQGSASGEHDFDLACDAFHRALANYEPPKDVTERLQRNPDATLREAFAEAMLAAQGNDDWIAETIKIFRDIYGTAGGGELIRASRGEAPDSFHRLDQELQARGYSLLRTEE